MLSVKLQVQNVLVGTWRITLCNAEVLFFNVIDRPVLAR
jgi:hypothetical protein